MGVGLARYGARVVHSLLNVVDSPLIETRGLVCFFTLEINSLVSALAPEKAVPDASNSPTRLIGF